MASILYLTQIHIDFGAVRMLRDECARIGISKPLVVSDMGVRAAGVLDKALAAIDGLPNAVYDQTPSNPTEAPAATTGDSTPVLVADSSSRRWFSGFITYGSSSLIDGGTGCPNRRRWWRSSRPIVRSISRFK